MRRYIKIDATGRLTSYADEGFHCGEGEFLAEIPEDFDRDCLWDYKYVDGAIIHDPLPGEDENDDPTVDDRVAQLEAQNAMLMECLLEMSEIVYA